MARYCVAFESMKRFLNFKGSECLAEMVGTAWVKTWILMLTIFADESNVTVQGI